MGFFLLFGFSPVFFERFHWLAASQRHLVAADGMTSPVNRSFVQKETFLLNFSIDILYSCFVFNSCVSVFWIGCMIIFNHIFLFFLSFF